MSKKAKRKKHPVRVLADYLEAIARVASAYSIQRDRVLAHVLNRHAQALGEDLKISSADLFEEIKRLYGERLQYACKTVSHGVEKSLPTVEGIHKFIAPASKKPLVWETNLAKTLRQLKTIIEVDSLTLLEGGGCGVPAIDGAIAFNQSVTAFSDRTLATTKKIEEKVGILLKKVENLRCVAIPGEVQTTEKTGRPTGSGDTDKKSDSKIAKDWKQWSEGQRKKGNHTASYAQYAKEKNLDEKTVKAAVDRNRKRKLPPKKKRNTQ